MAVFVSYMVNDMFGNSIYFVSPYFMIFLGFLAVEKTHKKSFFDDTKEITKEEAITDGK